MRRLFHSGILDLRSWAYSRACAVEWMEHGPTMTRTRSSRPASILAAAKRAEAMVLRERWEVTISCLRSAGWTRGSYWIADGMGKRQIGAGEIRCEAKDGGQR